MWLNLIQLILAIVIVCLILLQAKGTGLGTAFGGQSNTYHSKRGVEKVIFTFTLVCVTLFVIISLLNFRL
jgi:preprotein translocase subunit SecG